MDTTGYSDSVSLFQNPTDSILYALMADDSSGLQIIDIPSTITV